MKRLLSFLFAAVVCTTMMAQAVIKFEKTTLDFGTFHEKKYK